MADWVADWKHSGKNFDRFDNVGTPCGIACRVGNLKLKIDGTMVKLGRAAGLTGAMHKGKNQNLTKSIIKESQGEFLR